MMMKESSRRVKLDVDSMRLKGLQNAQVESSLSIFTASTFDKQLADRLL